MAIAGINNPFGRDGYFGRLAGAFGWRMVLTVMITYGLNQGGLSYWGRQGRAFFFRDAAPQGIELTPAQSLVVENFGKLPWDLKAIFGVLSDAFAIRGYHRTPYVLMAGIFGFVGWGLLGVLEAPSAGLVTILVILGNVSIAMPDVMIDATVAEKCGKKPEYAVELQSLGWGSIYFTSIVAPLAFGPMYEYFSGAQPIFLVCLIFPPMLFFPVLFGWLGEEKDDNPQKSRDEFYDIMKNALTCGSYQGKFAEVSDEARISKDLKDTNQIVTANPKMDGFTGEDGEEHTYSAREEYLKFGKLYLLAMVISVIVFTSGLVFSEYDEKDITIPVWIACVSGICAALWFLMGPITKDLATGAMYIFLRNALAPSGGNTITFWNSDTSEQPNNYNQCGPVPDNFTAAISDVEMAMSLENGTDVWGLGRPCLSTTFITSIDSLGGVMGLLGIFLYIKFLSHWSYRKIFTLTAVMGFAFNFLDYLWVTRANVDAGIPDEVMRLFGEEIVSEILGNWDTLPMFVLAAKLCPKGLEGTLFALMMGLSNFGRTMGAYMGSIVLTELKISQGDGFDNLSTWVLLRNFLFILVICLVPLLVPVGSPQDKSIYDNEDPIEAEMVGDGENRRSVDAIILDGASKRASLGREM